MFVNSIQQSSVLTSQSFFVPTILSPFEGRPFQNSEEPQEIRNDVEIPHIDIPLGKGQHFVKLPNFLSVDTRPFDPQFYEDDGDDDDLLDMEGRSRLKLKVENTIRWRYAKDVDGQPVYDESGQPLRESNTKVVRWSDNSLSLHVGGEIFDIHVMPLAGDHNHLFIRQGTGLIGQTVFKTKLAFRPHSTESFTHRKMTLAAADKTNRAQKVRIIPMAGKDPEAHRMDMMKREEEKLRASVRRESQQRRIREKVLSKGINESYLEDRDEGENTISISAIKNKYTKKNQPSKVGDVFTSSSDDDSSSLSSATDPGSPPPAAPIRDEESPALASKKKTKVVEESSSDESSLSN